ncbi:DUF1513 domain-containing protein [Inhella sp.]|uniref:DUF1513 domain-containing protein n=1 Tax=Inhella sp. TaxID=1921806 RepID=UPI0035AFA20F
MERRKFLLQLGVGLSAGLSAAACGALARAVATGESLRVAGGWLLQGGEHQVGVLRVDWAQGRVAIEAAHTVPSLPHAIVPEPGGGFLAVATRPGTWLARVDGEGQLAQVLSTEADGRQRTHDGHVIASADGQWLYTGETERATGAGWVSVRDARDLRIAAQQRTHGIDPHQILVDEDGLLLVANGGIPRTASGKKRDLDAMDPVLVHLDPRNGDKLGEWRLPDARLSPHHIAWNEPLAGGSRLLGIGLQAEHDDPGQRREAPLLAVWDGQSLQIPTRQPAEGYAGDVAAGPNGGFVLTAQKANRILLWQPHKPAEFLAVGEVQNPCGLWPLADGLGVAIGGGLGLARWHAAEPGRMLRWPAGLSAGNHWAVLG